MTLADAIKTARAQDLRARADQEAPTRTRLLPAIDAIVARLLHHRAAVDEAFASKRAASGLGSQPDLALGETSLAAYPVGFCGAIRDQVFERLRRDPVFHQLIGHEVVLKKVFVLLQGRYFQNALQLGNLYVDVANDTVFTEKPKLEWARIEDVNFENADNWKSVAAVARRYYQVELYPNFSFPFAFPAAPFFAVRGTGRVDLFHAQSLLFMKDLGDGMRRAHALLDDPDFATRRLPEPYERALAEACGANLHAAFPLEYAPGDATEVREKVLPEFAALAKRGDAAAFATVESYLRLVRDAAHRLARMNVRADESPDRP